MQVVRNNLENRKNLADNLSFMKLLPSHDYMSKS